MTSRFSTTRTRQLPPIALASMTALALALGVATVAFATTVQVLLPTLNATPGSTVDIAIESLPSPAGLGIYSIDFRLLLDPAVVQSSALLSDGYVQTWGSPFVNATPSFVAVGAAGGTPLGSVSTRIATVRLTLRPDAVLGTDMPLAFEHFWFNEGSPASSPVNGMLRIRAAGLGVEDGPGTAFAFAPAAPSPALQNTRLAFTLPAGNVGRVRLSIYSVEGRLVRTLEDGVLAAGPHAHVWDLRDAAGAPVAPGIYFAGLESATQRIQRRIVVTR